MMHHYARGFSILFVFVALSVLAAVASASGVDDAKAGLAALQHEEYDEAIRLSTRALESGELSSGYREMALSSRAVAWSYKKDYDHAIADYSEAIRLNPQLAQPFDNRGRAWYLKKDYDRAITDFSEAIRLNPHDAQAFNDRGFVQFRQARFELATTDFAQAQKLKPDDTYVAIWLYLARARGGAKDATSQLALSAKRLKADGWPEPLVALFTAKIDPKTVQAQAANADAQVQKNQMCEANFYLEEWRLLKHQKEEARTLFRQAQDECPKSFFEYDGAVAELKRM